MRIGLISTYPPIECGIAAYSQYLTDALRKKSTDVYIVSHIGGSGHQVFPAFDYEDSDLAEKAFKAMTRFTPDAVHIQHEFGLYGRHFGVSVIPLILQFRLAGIPVITTLHTVYHEIPIEHRVMFESIFSNSDKVVVHETYQAQSLLQLLGRSAEKKLQVIPHGAREVDSVPGAKNRLGLPEDKKVILLIGYLRPSKNFELVIDIFPEIVRRFPGAVLVVAGKTRGTEYSEYRDMLFKKIADSPNREDIFLIRGQLPQQTFDTILSAADVVILPYKIASQSGILAHCFAFGKPVVAGSTEAMIQTLEKSKSGIISETPEQFVSSIVRILKDDDLRQSLSENAKTYVKERISWSRIADLHIDVYQSVIHTPRIKSHIIFVE